MGALTTFLTERPLCTGQALVTFPGSATAPLTAGYVCLTTTFWSPKRTDYYLLQSLQSVDGILRFSLPPTYIVENAFVGRTIRLNMSTSDASSATSVVRLSVDPLCGAMTGGVPVLAAGTTRGRCVSVCLCVLVCVGLLPPPSRAPSQRPATVPLTAGASSNGICNRQYSPPTALATSSYRLPDRLWGRL